MESERTRDPVPATNRAGGGRVVVGLDGSDGARNALAWALAEAARRRADVQVVTAFAVDYYWSDAHQLDPRRLHTARTDTEERALEVVAEVRGDEAAVSAPGSADVSVAVTVVAGAPAEHLVDIATSDDLLVVGSRGRGVVEGAPLGSVALRCVMHARCPVVVVPQGWSPRASSSSVVVGFDGSPASRAALVAGIEAAGRRGGRVEVVTAFETGDHWVHLHLRPVPGRSAGEARDRAQAATSEAVREIVDGAGAWQTVVDVQVVEGPPATVLVDRAHDADLLVVGSRGHAALPGLVLGSVALRSVVRAPCPVMVVHPRPDDTPGMQG